MKSQIIELSNYRSPREFDYAAYNRRAEIRFRNSEIRAWVMHTVELLMTAAIGACSLFCTVLAFTML